MRTRFALTLTWRGLLFLWMPVAIILVWWFVPSQKALYFPSLKSIVDTFNTEWLGHGWAQMRTDLVPSVEHVAIGYGIAVFAGVIVGLLLASVDLLYRAALPLITFFRGLPSPALIPALLLIFGLGGSFKIAIIAFGSVWPVLLNAFDGFRSIDATYKDTANSYRLGPIRQILMVRIPAASPQIMAGARTSLQVALLLMVASEFLASTQGIGYALNLAQVNFDTPGLWSGMLLLGVLGIVLNAIFIIGERWLMRWYIGMRAREVNG
jgi:sulfonate transport system permease protein